MKTTIYMVRHAESPYTEGNERTRGLTPAGKNNIEKVTELLQDEGINHIVSSPYARAVLTVEALAQKLNIELQSIEDLRERHFAGEDYIIRDDKFMQAIQDSFHDPNYTLPGGETNADCQNRSVAALRTILEENKGKKIAIGTHGNVMTLMMQYFDAKYGFEFLIQTTKPDIYKMEFEDFELTGVTRLWNE
ncbi:histidine phosphatase family protein [Paenibacillus segetis]|uniref:Phosphoglycerate mutase n=1 Tax=Paenibacillus segetis TaxID=1325360 RepID=A0ABQ1YK30_9BACL|nr:histidine phosphatase family protein [Paenibacillus segetis]GGH27108.1 phosphoglycerate mutase [Paenibacillus segetis]